MHAPIRIALALSFATFTGTALAEAPEAAEAAAAKDAPADAAAPSALKLQLGSVRLGDGLARIELPEGMGYLDPRQTETLLEEEWGNPDGSGTLGMVLPVGFDPRAEESWGVVLSHLDEGHVDDEDAAEIDYVELLEEMQDDAKSANDARREAGFDTVELVGWAAPPRYDAAEKKLYWARELRFGDEPEHTLNYDVRVLGSEGVLSMNAVASMEQLPEIERQMQALLPHVAFEPGHRYADFDPSTGRMAAYGVAGLVAGKAAAKVGLFKGVFAALLAAKKLVLAGVVAIGAGLAKLLGRKKG